MTRRQLDEIRGKLLVGHATPEETRAFLAYVVDLESLLDEADCDDYFGTEGYAHRLGLE